jgi:hypothetical protein
VRRAASMENMPQHPDVKMYLNVNHLISMGYIATFCRVA